MIFGVLYFGFWAAVLLGVVYFGIRAYQRRKTEDFEDRSN
jgi:hypothetical protein